MRNRASVLIGAMIFLLCSATALAGDLSWQACRADAAALCQRGELTQAVDRAKFALNLARSKFGRDHLNVAKSLEQLGEICMLRGRLPQSDLFLKQALTIREKIHGDCDPGVIRLITTLADHSRLRRHYDQAEGQYRQALDLAAKGGLGESSHTAPALEGLARLYRDRGDYSSAEPLYERAIAIYETGGKYGQAEKLREARSSLDLADIKRANGDFRKARELYKTALLAYSRALGPTSLMTSVTYKRLADLYRERRIPSLARAYYERALAAYGATGLPEGTLTAATLAGLGNVLKSQGSLARSQDYYNAARAIYERCGGLDPELATMALTREKIWPSLSRR
jgi:tetratricopeptide (TPR) repeat protein